jgi:hypothetical protein
MLKRNYLKKTIKTTFLALSCLDPVILFEINPSTPRMVHMLTNINYDVVLGEST